MSQVSAMGPMFHTTEQIGKNVYVAAPKQEFYKKMEAEWLSQQNAHTNPPSLPVSSLTAEELKNLAEQYDLEHMTDESYAELLDKLVAAGVFEEGDKKFLGYPNATGKSNMKSAFDTLGSYVTPLGAAQYTGLGNANGNLLHWAGFRGSLDLASGGGGLSAIAAKSKSLYQRLSEVLQRMEKL